jgi:hypothetical protein
VGKAAANAGDVSVSAQIHIHGFSGAHDSLFRQDPLCLLRGKAIDHNRIPQKDKGANRTRLTPCEVLGLDKYLIDLLFYDFFIPLKPCLPVRRIGNEASLMTAQCFPSSECRCRPPCHHNSL